LKKSNNKRAVISAHSIHSSLREKVIEHKFISDVLSFLWSKRIYDVEIAKSEIDNAGYDVIITANKKTRYIQLKSSQKKVKSFPINLRLWEKENPFVIWIMISEPIKIDEQMQFIYYYASLKNINTNSLDTAINPRGKKPRPNIKVLPTSNNFTQVTISELLKKLFNVK
jgi:hypothetical protein